MIDKECEWCWSTETVQSREGHGKLNLWIWLGTGFRSRCVKLIEILCCPSWLLLQASAFGKFSRGPTKCLLRAVAENVEYVITMPIHARCCGHRSQSAPLVYARCPVRTVCGVDITIWLRTPCTSDPAWYSGVQWYVQVMVNVLGGRFRFSS